MLTNTKKNDKMYLIKDVKKMKAEKYTIDFNSRMENYNKNVKKLGKKANEKRITYNFSFNDIAKNCNMSKTTVSDFLQNRTSPNIVTVSTVIKSIEDLIKKNEMKVEK